MTDLFFLLKTSSIDVNWFNNVLV